MGSTSMLSKAATTATAVRTAGAKVFHAPIMFKADASDNPNKGLGILAGCAKDSLFTEGTWHSAFCESMQPADGDLVVLSDACNRTAKHRVPPTAAPKGVRYSITARAVDTHFDPERRVFRHRDAPGQLLAY